MSNQVDDKKIFEAKKLLEANGYVVEKKPLSTEGKRRNKYGRDYNCEFMDSRGGCMCDDCNIYDILDLILEEKEEQGDKFNLEQVISNIVCNDEVFDAIMEAYNEHNSAEGEGKSLSVYDDEK